MTRRLSPATYGRTLAWLFRLFRRREPTTYHRCLAVHLHYATKPRSALS